MQSMTTGSTQKGLRELSAAETKQVAGGIIIVGGIFSDPAPKRSGRVEMVMGCAQSAALATALLEAIGKIAARPEL